MWRRMNPYAELIGKTWDSLPESVRLAHTAPLRASGWFTMRRGAGRLRGWIADRLGLPEASDRVRVVLDVSCRSTEQIWVRSFAGRPMRTVQTFEKGVLVEASGPMAIFMRVEAAGDCIQYQSAGGRTGFGRSGTSA
jgi:hypothetical protein